MLLLQFVFIIVDRALYLRKNLIGKIVFQYISVIGIHIWLFFLVPALSERLISIKQNYINTLNYTFTVGVLMPMLRQLHIICSNAATFYCPLIKYVVVSLSEFWAIA